MKPPLPTFLRGLLAGASAWLCLHFSGLGTALADVVVLEPDQDNTLYEDPLGSVSNGAGDHFFAGQTDGNLLRRGLVRFGVAASIPAGATVNSVTLTMYVSRTRSNLVPVSLYRVTQDWGEGTSQGAGEEGQGAPSTAGDATWVHTFYPAGMWSSQGGDYAGTASATTTVGKQNNFFSWSTPGMASDVQDWLDTPASNFGWIVIGNEGATKDVKRFDSRTNSIPAQRPKLTVDYTPASPVGACCLPEDVCTVVSLEECALQSGVYHGDGTSCSPDPCTVPTGACCFDDGTCSEETEADCLAASGNYGGDGTVCLPDLCPVVLEPFVDSLPRPGVAVPVSGTPGGAATYDMVISEFNQKLHRDLPATRLWGFAGGYPGPTIEVAQNVPITVNWINDLRDSSGAPRTVHYLPVDLCLDGPDTEGATPRTVPHLHGGHVEHQYDGYPEATFLPGQQATYIYPNNQLPATLWYHDHALGITRLNVIMGLAGFYLIRNPVEAALGLPSGEFEIPLAIQDRKFRPDGTLVYPASWEEMFFGDKLLVNGKVWPYLNVKQGKYRFRLLNGSTSRAYVLHLSSGDPFEQIGTDGGLLPAPVLRDTIVLVPGERADVIVDFAAHAPGAEIFLVNSAPAPFPGDPGVGVIPDVMKFIVQGAPGHTDPIPASLTTLETLDEGDAIQHRDLLLGKVSDPCTGFRWTINGLGWDDITETPYLGTTEVWKFINPTGTIHPMHMHLVMFRVLDRQFFASVGDSIVPIGSPTPPDSGDAGWKDTVPVYPNEMVRVIARFEDYTGLFPYHCHILEHEDHEMMRQFEVLDPVAVTPDGPLRLQLRSIAPNPFGKTTEIAFELPRPAEARLAAYDVSGRLLAVLLDEDRPAGLHRVSWDGRNGAGQRLAPGIYLLKLQVEGYELVRKAVLVR